MNLSLNIMTFLKNNDLLWQIPILYKPMLDLKTSLGIKMFSFNLPITYFCTDVWVVCMSMYPKAHLKQWWNGEQVPQKCQGTLLNMLLFSSYTAHAAGSMVPRWIRCHGMESTTKSTTTMLYGEFPCLVMAFGTHVHQSGIEQVYETKVSVCYLYSTAGYLIPCRWIENMQKYSILYIQDLRNLLLIERFLPWTWTSVEAVVQSCSLIYAHFWYVCKMWWT